MKPNGFVEAVEIQIVTRLLEDFKTDASPAAVGQLLKVLEAMTLRQATENHRTRMDRLRADPVEMCRYLGELGHPVDAVPVFLGRAENAELSGEEIAAYTMGRQTRQLEMKAIELTRIRTAMDKVPSRSLK